MKLSKEKFMFQQFLRKS